MTPDEVIKMAREAGWSYMEAGMQSKMLERFAALVAAAEREACAQVCDHMEMYGLVAEVQQRYNKAYADCRDAIRARGESK